MLEPVKSDTGQILTLREWRGVDLWTHATALPPNVFSRSENIDLQRGPASRRAGAVKVAQLAVQGTNGNSRLFGADTKYMVVTANAALLIPKGGFFLLSHFLVIAGVGTTFLLANRQSGQTYGVVWLTMSAARELSANVRWTNNTTTTLTTAALTNGSTQHLFLVYDDVAGTLTLYLNGASAASASPGAGLQPHQAAVDWHVGVEWDPGAGPPAVVAGTAYLGDIDGFTLGSLQGLRPSSGDVTFVETVRRASANVWPTPQADFIRAHYDFDEASGTVAYDRSRNKNHGTYVGTPTVSTPLAQLSAPCHHIGRILRPDGEWALVGSFGGLHYQKIGGLA